jgi:hypothetical protein
MADPLEPLVTELEKVWTKDWGEAAIFYDEGPMVVILPRGGLVPAPTPLRQAQLDDNDLFVLDGAPSGRLTKRQRRRARGKAKRHV